ncbi:MAG: D-alanine--D-alanine ligase [Candidatus Krumholzibacteriota bacterium]|nr:D-alanine--D-alanine ligase [Candidatus Krumholzibacteriota bacterium]
MKIAVLLGGRSPERDVSIASGTGVLAALRRRGHDAAAVDPALPGGEAAAGGGRIDETPGTPPPPLEPGKVLGWLSSPAILEAEAVFVGLHGGSGEDGTVQALLGEAGIPFAGTGVLGSALAMDKDRSKALFREAGVSTADHLLVPAGLAAGDFVGAVRERIGYPLVVKPNTQGSSVGFSFVEGPDALDAALAEAHRWDDAIVEAYVPGREVTVAILDGRALPVVEIIPEGGFYDYKRKYTKGTSRYVAPADLPAKTAGRLAREAVLAFRALRCRDYARVDFRLREDGVPACLEVNTLPGMTELSLVPMAAAAAGIGFDELVERICRMAVERRSTDRS